MMAVRAVFTSTMDQKQGSALRILHRYVIMWRNDESVGSEGFQTENGVENARVCPNL